MEVAEVTTPEVTPAAVVETSTPAAPATTEPSATPTASPSPKGPMSAKQALETVAARDESPAAVPGAAPTGQPAQTPVPAEPAKGPIPFDVHHTALENARTKAATEAVQQRDAQWQRETGWVVSLPPEQRAGLRNIARDIYSNPLVFGERYVQQLLQHPQHGSAFKATLASLIGVSRPADDAEPPPDVQIMNEHGQAVSMGYSAAQQMKLNAWLKKQYMAEVQQQIAPLQEDRDRRDAEQKAAEFKKQVDEGTDQAMARIADILDGRQDLFQHVDARIASGMDMIDAALAVKKQYITPQHAQQAAAAAAETMRRKAVAGNTANGGGTTTVPVGRPKNHKELAALLESLESRG